MLKTLLFTAFLAHLLCGFTDCLLGFRPDRSRIDIKTFGNAEKMPAAFEGYPPRYAYLSMVLGVLAMSLFGCGYFRLIQWMEGYSHVKALIMSIGVVIYLLPGIAHHVFCGVTEWFYVRLGRTAEACEVVMEFFKKTIFLMFFCYLGLVLFCVPLFIAIVSGDTDLPRWACIFNTIPLYLVLLPTKLPAQGNIAGAVMFLGLFCLI